MHFRQQNVDINAQRVLLRARACKKTTPPSAKGGFPGNIGNHIAMPLQAHQATIQGLCHGLWVVSSPDLSLMRTRKMQLVGGDKTRERVWLIQYSALHIETRTCLF